MEREHKQRVFREGTVAIQEGEKCFTPEKRIHGGNETIPQEEGLGNGKKSVLHPDAFERGEEDYREGR